MSEHGWRSVDAGCPFYRGDSKRVIYCEGMNPGETIMRKFSRAEDCTQVFRESCCRRYGECPVHKLIMTKYRI